MNAQKGFTLIELMIVVAIIGILAAIAIPAYQNYIARSQMSEALTLASAQKGAVAEYYGDKGSWPTTNASAGIATAAEIKGNYVDNVSIGTNGVITATMKSSGINSNITQKTLTLTPTDEKGSISWVCGSNAAQKYLPKTCNGTS
ncbi:pilin [Acinetobacter soli]|uniref:pilin n=1 Tax=Acinetobacter soli TaxID=487316 RepID=UPI00125037D9|nr:pilin [Acinetobacter soli]MDS7695393.1 pilin [Acinetobacter soli]